MSAASLPPIAVLERHLSILEATDFQLIGMLVVLAALSCIWLLLELTGACFRSRKEPAHGKATPAAAPYPAPDDLDPETLAAIAAAIHATTGSHHRIVSIESPSGRGMGWSQEGRRQIYQSHKIR